MSETIRIGTLVNAGMKSGGYIKQISGHGFESYSLTFWQTCQGVEWKKLADDVKAATGGKAVISSLGIFGNPLETGEKDLETVKSWEDCIDNAHLFGADIVAGFAGRLRNRPVPESIPRFREVFGALAKRAADKGVRIAFENCDMGGNWASGDWNIAMTPAAWEMMFNELPDKNLGLQWEPCHQLVKLIDPIAQLRKWAPKVFHVHGKDATVCHDIVREKGIIGSEPFAFHRTPGFGDSNWTEIISILRKSGFKGSIDIEGWHDPVYRGELEMTGQVHALNFLKFCRGGGFVPNPAV
jgi:sugar phosphate isomerase/epimerase